MLDNQSMVFVFSNNNLLQNISMANFYLANF